MVFPKCEEHGKSLYSSSKQARETLARGMRGKRIRVYECFIHPGKYHITKELQKVRNHERNRRSTRRGN